MKHFRKAKILIIAMILILGGMICSTIYAADTEGEDTKKYLNISSSRPFSNPKIQYHFYPPQSNGAVIYYNLFKIYNINDPLYLYSYYCLRGGLGFGADGSNPDVSPENDDIPYIMTSEMHENAGEVIEEYKTIYNIDLNRTPTIDEKKVNIYNAILWILDESYLPNDVKTINEDNEEVTVYNERDYKKELLTKANIDILEEQEAITKDDIEVIQQLAIWYFTNYPNDPDPDVNR